MYAIKIADVSFQTPLMNTKILMVVVMAYFAGAEVIRWNWWISAFLTVFAVFIMNKTSKTSASPQTSLSPIFWTLACAFLYAICEVYMEIHSPQFGETAFLIILIVVNSLASLAIVPFFEKSSTPISAVAWGWLLAGSFALALETVTLYLPITLYGNASVVNILYSSRGLWSLFLVCVVGKWFGNTESQLPTKILITRAWGALLLTVGISIIFIP
jgi:drug/metabolite transporter (DMT)-like permease